MSLALTDRQRQELNLAILDYLSSQGDKYLSTIQSFKQESGIAELTDPGKALLEKKWTSVVRLQKRVMELEAKVEQLQHQRVFHNPEAPEGSTEGAVVKQPGDSRMIPKPPAKVTLSGHRAPVTIVVTHPIYSIIASGSEDTTIRIWDHETNQYERTLKGHTGTVTGLAFDARGSILASCSNDMSAKLWDMNTYTCTKTLKGHDHTISAVLFTPGGETVLTCSRDETIKCWDVHTGYCARTLSGHSDWVKCMAISMDGAYLASAGSDQVIHIWQLGGGSVVQSLRGHEHVVECLHYGKKPVDVTSVVSSPRKEGGANGEAGAKENAVCKRCICMIWVWCMCTGMVVLWV
ncbi:hypothetical protein EON65_01055 [archaeon]|nr:MAG: hypothetical protein EON65_01055 [archaeon]